MKTTFPLKSISLLSMLALLLGGVFIGGVQTASAEASNLSIEVHPHILANPSADWVYGIDWPLGVDLTLTIGDYSVTATTVVSPWSENDIEAYFDLSSQVDLAPGDIVTIMGADITKTLVITNFSVTNLDVTHNTLSGTASAGGSVCAYSDAPGEVRCTSADQDGLWSMPSDPAGFVFAPGVSGSAVEFDPDGDQTRMDWSVPNLTLEVHPQDDWVYAFGWDKGVKLTLSVADARGNHLGNFTTIVGGSPWDPDYPRADFTQTDFDFQPGQVLTVSGSGLTIAYTIQNPKVTRIDMVADTISGTGTPGERMHICANLPDQCIERWTTIDEHGNWVVNFNTPSDPSDSPGSFTLQPGSTGWAVEIDAPGNQTWADGWWRPIITLNVNPQHDWLDVYGLDVGFEVTLSIADVRGNLLGNYTATVAENSYDPNFPQADFSQTGFDFKPGQVLTVSWHGFTKTYTIQNPKVTKIDVIADTISGTGTPGDQVHLCANLNGQCNEERWESIDKNGNWVISFAAPTNPSDTPGSFDLQPGSNGWADEIDADWDQTWANDWVIPSPTSGSVYGEGWFNSPAGAYTAKPGFTGKADFTLDVKYMKKSIFPKGTVEFAFKGFDFTSSSFDWMAIAGSRMQLTGVGRINGKGSYGFMIITAGKITRGVEKDTIRVRIWRKDTGLVVYDNMPGAADSVIPLTPVQGIIKLIQ
jgi:hypothetical protein